MMGWGGKVVLQQAMKAAMAINGLVQIRAVCFA